MRNTPKTKPQLLEELSCLRSRVAELEERNGKGQKVSSASARLDRTGIVNKEKPTAGRVRGNNYRPSSTSRVREAIQETEARFHLAFEEGIMAMATFDPSLRIVRVNRAFREILEYGEKEFVGRTLREITHAEDLEQSLTLMNRMFEGELSNFHVETRFLAKSQTVVWGHVNCTVVRDIEGTPSYALATIENITERKRAEGELKKAHRKLETRNNTLIRHNESFVQALGEIMYDYNIVDDYTRWTGAYLQLLGYSLEEMGTNRESWLSKVHPDDYNAVVEEFKQAQTERRLYHIEYRVKRFAGNYIWVQDRGVLHFNPDGHLNQLLGILVNITERKHVELELSTRASQQASVATLGTEALSAGRLVRGLMEEAAVLIAGLLETEYSQVLEYIPENHTVLLQAGIGWQEGLVGSAEQDADPRFQIGYTLGSQEPVIVEDFNRETRFTVGPLLDDQNIRSGVSIAIPGPDQPFGALGVYTRTPHTFSQQDIHFLQGIANVLGEFMARNKIETALLEEDATLHGIIEGSPAAIYVKDLQGRYIIRNQKHKAFWKNAQPEIEGRTDYDLFPPEIAEALQADDQKVLLTGNSMESEERIPHKEGIHTFLSNKFPLRNQQGTPYAICGISTDITERKRAEIALGETKKEYEQLVNTVKGIVWEADLRTFQFTLVSQEAERLLGYPCKRWIEEPTFWQDHIHPEDRDWAMEYCIKNSARHDHYEFEYRMIAANGDVVWLRDLVTVVWDKGERTKLQGVMVDITEQKLAQKAIRESEIKLQQITDSVPGAVYQYQLTEDGSQSLNFISGGVEELFELTQAEAQEDFSRVWNMILPEDQPTLWDSIQVSAKTMRPWSYEYRVRTASGKVKWLRGSSIPEQQKEDNSIVWNGLLSDITELKQAESLLAGQKSTLEQIALSTPLPEILTSLCQMIEAQSDGMFCSILLLEGDQLRHGAAPSLPDSFSQKLDGMIIGPAVGSCGTAAFRKEPVIVSNIATDPLWEKARHFAIRHGLQACWSTPILSTDGSVLGTFATYYTQPRLPCPKEQELVRVSTYLAGIAIQRTRDQEDLRASEDRFRNLYESAPFAYFSASMGGQIKIVNTRGVELLGYTKEELIGRSVLDLYAPTPHGKAKAKLLHEQLTSGQEVIGEELEMEKADGTRLWTRLTVRLIFNDQGEPVERRGVIEDITERKQAEEALKASEERYRMLVEHSPYCIHQINKDSRLISMNRAGLQMVGLKEERKVLDRPYLSFVRDKDRERIGMLLNLAFNGEASEFEFGGPNGLITSPPLSQSPHLMELWTA